MRVSQLVRLGVSASLLVLCAACAQIGTPASHAQEAAQNIAENERFGRIELVLEKVAPSARADFVKAHSAWGGRVTIADAELGNFHMSGTEDAEMNLRVTWYFASEQELRTTTLRQKWHGPKGNWQLTSEERVDGDIGLLGEKVIVQAPDEAPKHAQFPTVRIGAVD
jgi:hypothetical protein